MAVLIVTSVIFITAWLIHVIWWRISLPKNPVPTLIRFFLFFMAASLVFIVAAQRLQLLKRIELSSVDVFHVIFFFFAMTFVYALVYLGIKDVGPSFLILQALKQCAKEGMTAEDFQWVVTNEYLIDTRLKEMLSGKLLRLTSSKYQILKYGQHYLDCYYCYRRILNKKAGEV